MHISEIIKKFLDNSLESALQSIELLSSINTEKGIKKIFQNLEKEIHFALNASEKDLKNHYINIGKLLFENKLSFITIMNIIEKFKSEMEYAISHNIVKYNDNEFSSRLNTIIQGISYAYFLETLNKITANLNKEELSIEIDINAHKNWYKKLLKSITQDTEKSLLIYEKSDYFKWINSLDFKLLTKACDPNTKNEIIFLGEKTFEIAREIVFYKEKGDYKNAYQFLIYLDQQMNIIYNILKNILIKFMESKDDYFFSLFSDLILFRKDFTFFLIFTIKKSVKTIHKKDIQKAFFNIFKLTKEKIKEMGNDFVGIINDSKEMKFIISYNKEFNHEEIFNMIVKIIEDYKKEELILNIPDLIVRSTNTEIFSGLNPDILKKIAYIMTKDIKEIPYYHFKKEESKNLIKKAKKQIKINKEIINAIKNETIEIFFQPIVHIHNNKKEIVYSEALSRLISKNEKIDMQEFVDYIVEENLGDDFDKIVYKKLSKMAQEISRYIKGVSVNIIPTSFLNKEVIDLLVFTIEKFKKFNLFLVLEITEYNLFEYYGLIKKLKNTYPETLKIAIDDFGSGYSSFSTLIKLSKENLLDVIKIDGSITKNILNDELNLEILKMSIEIAKKLNKKIVIEYVENKQIEEKIKEICNDFYAQGYLFSEAVPIEKIKEIKF